MADAVSSSTSTDALIQALTALTASTSSSTTSTTTSKGVGGLASGIDTKALIDAMIASDRSSTRMLELRMQQFQKRQEGVRSLNTKLLSAQLDLSSLKLSGTINGRTVSSSDDKLATATANSTATIGSSLSVEVTSVAKADQIATTGQASASTGFGAGTITLKVGNGAEHQIAIGSSSSSLNDIAKAINAAGAGVTAAVVKDTGASPYRLVLTGKDTGAANTIAASADAGNAALAALFTGEQVLTAASDATIKIGEGATPITVSSTSNTFTEIAPGVNLTVKDKGKVTVTVGTDTTKAKEGIKSLVTNLNSAITYLNDNSKYNATTKSAGVLIQESDLRTAVNAVVRTMTSTLPGLSSTMNSVFQLGISVDKTTGVLTLDEAKLDAALAGNPQGVADLFLNTGTSSSTGVSFGALGATTKTSSPFNVSITTAAQQAQLTGSAPLTDPTVIDSSNNKLSLLINGHAYNLTLSSSPGYTPAQLSDHLQGLLDTAVKDAPGDRVTVGLDGSGNLQLTTRSYGSSASIEVQATSTAAGILGLGTTKVSGVDVQGTINGSTAKGTGQVLEGADKTDAAGLTLLVTATGPLSNVSVTARKGLAQSLQDRLSALTDVESGVARRKDTAYQNIITDQQKRIAAADERLAQRRKYYDAKFLRMEQLTARYQGMSSYLTQFSTSSSSNSNK